MIDQGLRTGGAAAQTKDAFLGGAAAPLRSWGLGVRPVFKRSGVRSQETAESFSLHRSSRNDCLSFIIGRRSRPSAPPRLCARPHFILHLAAQPPDRHQTSCQQRLHSLQEYPETSRAVSSRIHVPCNSIGTCDLCPGPGEMVDQLRRIGQFIGVWPGPGPEGRVASGLGIGRSERIRVAKQPRLQSGRTCRRNAVIDSSSVMMATRAFMALEA